MAVHSFIIREISKFLVTVNQSPPWTLLLRCRRLIGEEGTSEAQKSCRGLATQSVMMQQMQQMMDGMMWGMGLGGLIVLILVALAIAALAKYIFFQ